MNLNILPEEQEIEQKIHKFKSVLDNKKLTNEIIVQKYIIDGTSHVFRNNEEAYFDLKSSIGTFFNEKPTNIPLLSLSGNKEYNS
ncbi:hypothetical protein NIES4074_59690 (plasmid) [Cylindrospermum sp. NIES-4074]|nr:hypothetical protein NIES4074_59690 [Cylindrospermum sp. NIES-4074]